MGRNRDQSGVDNTCPLIDEVISCIENCDDESIDKTRLVNVLEQIRKMNSDLRSWGNEQYDLAVERGDTIEEHERIIDRLNYDISYYEKEVKQLNEQISQLESA